MNYRGHKIEKEPYCMLLIEDWIVDKLNCGYMENNTGAFEVLFKDILSIMYTFKSVKNFKIYRHMRNHRKLLSRIEKEFYSSIEIKQHLNTLSDKFEVVMLSDERLSEISGNCSWFIKGGAHIKE